jgi:hypothetical protein
MFCAKKVMKLPDLTVAFQWLTYTYTWSWLFAVTADPWKAKALDGFAAQLFYDLRTRALHCSLSQLFHERQSLRRLCCAAFLWRTYTSSSLFCWHSCSMKGKSLRRLCCAAFQWLTYRSSRLFTVTAVSWKSKLKRLRRLYCAAFQWLTYTRALECSTGTAVP